MLQTLTHSLSVKEVNSDGEFEGYGAIFGNVDRGEDVVEKGAFAECLRTKPVKGIKMLYQHRSDQPCGMWTEMKEDERGLYVRGKVLQSIPKGAECLELMRAGILDGLSIGYQVRKSQRDDKTGVRRLLEVDLWEVSLVTFPMNEAARVNSVKDFDIRDVERSLRDAGMPNTFAKLVATHGYAKASEIVSRGPREADDGRHLVEGIKRLEDMMKGV